MNPQIELLTKLHYYLTNWTLFRPLFHRPPPRISLPLLLLFLFLLIMMMIGAYLQFYQPPPQTKTHTPNNNNKTKMLLDNGTTIAECRWCEAKLSRPKDWELSESASLWTSRPDWDSRWHVREDGKWRIYSIPSLYASSSLSRLTTGGGQDLWLWLREIDWPDILCISNHNDEEVPGESSKSPEWILNHGHFPDFIQGKVKFYLFQDLDHKLWWGSPFLPHEMISIYSTFALEICFAEGFVPVPGNDGWLSVPPPTHRLPIISSPMSFKCLPSTLTCVVQ